jgi:hypothetical protein
MSERIATRVFVICPSFTKRVVIAQKERLSGKDSPDIEVR